MAEIRILNTLILLRGRGTEQMKFVKVFNFMIGIQSVSGYEETAYWEKG